MMRTYPGTTSNIMIFKDLYNRLLERGYRAVIIDRGMSCEDNIRRILEAKMEIICGVRKNDQLQRRFLSRIRREALYQREHRVKLQSAGVYIQSFPYLRGEIIVVYNPSLEVVRREIAYEMEKTREKDFRDESYSLLYHNTRLPPPEVTLQYFQKEIVDRAFKKLKGTLSLQPIRVWQNILKVMWSLLSSLCNSLVLGVSSERVGVLRYRVFGKAAPRLSGASERPEVRL
jgi:transposase